MSNDLQHLQKTDLGIEVRYAAPLSYLLVWVSSLAMLFLEKKNPYVRFHAAQSVVLFGGLTVVSAIAGAVPLIGWLFVPVVGLIAAASWLFMMFRAYDDSRDGLPLKLPVIGDLAQKLLDAWQV
jgi:uncharacterized membrane protein